MKSSDIDESPARQGRRLIDVASPAFQQWAFTLLLVGGIAASSPLWGTREAPLAGENFPWLVMLALFFAAEVAVVHLYFDRNSRSFSSFSLGEIPLAIGLFFLSPAALLTARLLALGVALAIQGHRNPLKFTFNISSYALETAVALLVFHAVLGQGEALSPHGWVAAFIGVTTATLLGSPFLVPIMVCLEQRTWRFDRVWRILPVALIAAVTNTSIGLLAVTVLAFDVRASWLLLQIVALLFLAYRGYTTLREKHESLALLHEFTQKVGSSLEEGRTADVLLRQSLALLRAEVAEITMMTDPTGINAVQMQLRIDEEDKVIRQIRVQPGSEHAEVIKRNEPLFVKRGSGDDEMQSLLARYDVRDLIMVPLRGDKGIVGTVLIGGRLGEVGGFTADDVKLCQTVANHASILLENGRLIDRLRQEVEEKEHQASHDSLTGLPNRMLFHERVQEAVLSSRKQQRKVGVMLLDLDRFKEVNDTLGHHIGDELLQEVGARLARTLQRADTVARLGGDEFAILLPDIDDEQTALDVANRARLALEQPFTVGDLTLVIGASIGIAISPDHGDLATGLLQRADVAMYTAKGEHTGVSVYSQARDEHSPRRLALVAELRTALERGNIDVHYQPKADLRTGKIIGVEALVRWFNPERGLIPPDEFVPIAERTGLIHPLTTHVVRTALHQCREWRRRGRRLDVAVNLSVSSLLNLELPAEIGRLLAQAGVAPTSLTLEITESSIMADPTRSVQVLGALHAMGIRLAIDDFGTGYSSLSHLKRLPVDELKIDKSFVLNMASDDNDAVIVRSTVDLGHNLGLRVVAEGVEDHETWKRLAALGCDTAQGYYLSRALAPASLDEWLVGWGELLTETRGPGAAEAADGATETPDIILGMDNL